MSRLQDNLDEILRQKLLNVLPENIRQGISLYGVDGEMTTENMWQPIYTEEGSYYILSFVNPDGNFNVENIYGYDNYRIVKFYNDTRKYLYDVIMDKPKLLTPDLPTDIVALLGYTDTDIYLMGTTSKVCKYNLEENTVTTDIADLPYLATAMDEDPECNTTMHFAQTYYNGYSYIFSPDTNTWTKQSNVFLNSNCYSTFTYNGYRYWLNGGSYNSSSSQYTTITNLSSGVSKTISAASYDGIQGFTPGMDGIIIKGKLYNYDFETGVGELIGDTEFTGTYKYNGSIRGYYPVFPINDKYVAHNNKLYEYNATSKTFTFLVEISKWAAASGHFVRTIIGYTFLGKNYYFNTGVPNSSDKILAGNTFRDNYNQVIQGTMPDNGTLSITPAITSQTLPEGYISGGTVAPVTSAIDVDIKPENIRYGVEILGVAGVLEESTEESVMSQEEYDTCLSIADSILGTTSSDTDETTESEV